MEGLNISERSAKNLDSYGDLLTTKDLAAFFGVSKQTVYGEIRDGRFGKPLKFGREYRIPKVYIVQRYLSDIGDEEKCNDSCDLSIQKHVHMV